MFVCLVFGMFVSLFDRDSYRQIGQGGKRWDNKQQRAEDVHVAKDQASRGFHTDQDSYPDQYLYLTLIYVHAVGCRKDCVFTVPSVLTVLFCT